MESKPRVSIIAGPCYFKEKSLLRLFIEFERSNYLDLQNFRFSSSQSEQQLHRSMHQTIPVKQLFGL